MDPVRPLPKFTIADAVTYSWNACWRSFGPMCRVSLVVFVGNVLAYIVAAASQTSVLGTAFTLLALFLDVALVFGLVRASLDVVEGRTPVLAEAFRPDGYGPYLVASVLFLVGTNLGLILIVPGIVFAVVFQFYAYVIAEHPQVRAVDALRRSAQITRGARLRLLGLAAVLLFLNLAGAFVCFVGLIVTYAISATALAYVYRLLTGQPIAAL
ncbi:MAG TPA: hypothetical protein VGU73_04670 [Acidimicrobiia bacterium]|nr:hypothetical protein [Acidimicrobiia bacterium]